ncbi:FAST kinase domain-containing protein 1, mitochondrial [Echinops telfairi]|uniref:FAST kinase domain-containing protein 1, mitochondrial n=1 Tax=Echinops telfairi TaxID=9371 RepID=A0ABM0ZQP3_ECHTE|nr:FAST kinase domain-containing protein 1, mitochondrial [Echinops telfairi]
MQRLRTIVPCFWRVFQLRPSSCEMLTSQMNKCTDEEQIFDLIERNKATLSEKQVGCAFNILWEFQKQKTSVLKSVAYVKDHSQFLTLRNVTTDKVELMTDDSLVNVLYIMQQFGVEPHDPLIEALVMEACRRLERFDITVLSKFSSCLTDQHLNFSPLMGKIADIVNRNLETIQDLSDLIMIHLLFFRIASVVHKNLDTYKPQELLKITRALIFLHFQSKDIFVKLRELLLSGLKTSVVPREMALLAYALSKLPWPHLDDAGTARVQAVLPQCDLSDLSSIATCVSRWIQCEPRTHLSSVTGTQLSLLHQLAHHGRQRLRASSSLDQLWEELKSLKGDWLAESLLEDTMATLQQLAGEINVTNVVSIASFISRTRYLSTALLDRIAAVVLQQIEKIHPLSILAIILPFSILNYDPPQRDEFLGTCIQRLNSYLSTFDPLMLVFLAFSLATLEHFPEELIKAIFNIKFLSKLDYQLEFLPSSLNLRVQLRLMELNRAVCLECPEFQIPWFHDRFCQQLHNKDSGSINGAQHQMYNMLAEVLGGINCVKASVPTPYYYTLHFECILDKRKKPLPYESQNTIWWKVPDVHWKSNIQIAGSRLPPGAERIALEFLDSRVFCRNIHHLKGISAMKIRHLEILGYHVIQIPHFEWNSMALSTKDAQMDYLRERIFGEGKSSS